MNFFKYVDLLLKKRGCVPAADHSILFFAFDFSYHLSVSFQIAKQSAYLKQKEKVGYRCPSPKCLRLNILSHVVIENT